MKLVVFTIYFLMEISKVFASIIASFNYFASRFNIYFFNNNPNESVMRKILILN